MNSENLLLTSCLVLAGCAAQPIYVPLPTSHPASPWACESPVPAQSSTLMIRQNDQVPPHPDWQIPGMRDNELHRHAAGRPSSMDMMGHGHMMGGEDGAAMEGHGGHGGSNPPPGMVKMSAPKDKVDYTPKDAYHPSGREPKEHDPERHLDHTDPARRKAGFKAAPVAPPMKHDEEKDGETQGHEGHQMPADTGPEPAKEAATPEKKEAAPIDHEAMGHTQPSEPSGEKQEEKPAPADTPAPAMDHSNHG